MKIVKTRNLCSVLLILAGFFGISYKFAVAENAALSMVFDPETKKYFIGANAKFLLKEQEHSAPADGIEISVDGNDFQAYSGNAISFNSEGKHTLKFRAKNPVSNWSPVQYMEVFCDLTPPTTEVRYVDDKVFHADGSTIVPLNGGIILVAQDNLSGVANLEYSWDGNSFKTYTKPITVERMGERKLYYRSVDRVGNTEPVKTLAIVVDGTPPLSTLKHVGPPVKQSVLNGKPYLAASDGVAFSIEADDDIAKVKDTFVSVDGAAFQLYQKPIYFLQEGPHLLKYYSEDRVANKEEVKTVAIYTISTPPKSVATTMGTVVNTGGINFATRLIQLKIEAKDNVIGLERIDIKIDDEKEFHTYLEPVRFDKLGMHMVTYRAVDRVGNMEPSKTFNLNIQENAPETSIETAQPVIQRSGVNYSAAPNVVTLNVKNNSVGVLKTVVSINDGPFTPYQGPLTLTTEQKVYKIVYKSIDKLGNEESPKTVTYHMVGTIPVVDLFVSDGKNSEEQVRTNYFDTPASTTNVPTAPKNRGTASDGDKPAKNKKP